MLFFKVIFAVAFLKATMLTEKIYKSLRQVLRKTSCNNFPDDVIKIIVGYADFPQFSGYEIDLVREASYSWQFLSNDFSKVRSLIGHIIARHEDGRPCYIFDKTFPKFILPSREDVANTIVEENMPTTYLQACQQKLSEEVFPFLANDYKNLEIHLYEGVTSYSNFNPFRDSPTDCFLFSGIETWKKTGTIRLFSKDHNEENVTLNWGRLLNIISQSNLDLESSGFYISSIDFDYRHSKFIASIKIERNRG